MNPSAPIYLDNNSTTPIHPEVAESMLRAATDLVGNPASQHSLGRKTRRVLEEVREGIVSLLGGKSGGMEADRLIFTSGGTEANQLAIRGWLPPIWKNTPAAEALPRYQGCMAVSAIEHPSVASVAEALHRERQIVLERWTVEQAGMIKTHEVDFGGANCVLHEHTILVSIMLANNETGVIQPVSRIAELCAKYDIPVHTDAVQAVGKIPIDFRDLGVAAMSVAPHKFHGPLGIGGLLLKHRTKLEPLFHGGFQQGGLRPGTESVALAVGFYTALVMADRELSKRQTRMTALREELETLLLAGAPGAVIIGAASPRLPTTTCIAFPGINRQALVMALDMAGVACSTGSACASGSSEPSATLVAMGLPQEQIESAIRLSLSAVTTPAEVQEAAQRILKCVNHLRRQ
ncbi:MAG: cysteine desulfurase [Pirellulaceae bacterium]|nr:cysteine desulfurase [Pirellulaceae bacterium]